MAREKRLARLAPGAAYVGESRTTFWRHIKAGIWPRPIDVGGVPMVDLDEIDERIDRLKAQRDAEAA